jgi:hypothetical protein
MPGGADSDDACAKYGDLHAPSVVHAPKIEKRSAFDVAGLKWPGASRDRPVTKWAGALQIDASG